MPISLGFGELGCPYQCDTSTKCPSSLRGGRKKGMGWGGGGGRRNCPSQFPFRQSSTPFDACFAVWSPYTVEFPYDEGLRDWQKICSQERVFFLSKFSFLHFCTITGAKEIVPYTEDLVI